MGSEQDLKGSKGDKACEHYIPPRVGFFCFVLHKISSFSLHLLGINPASSKFITEGKLHPF